MNIALLLIYYALLNGSQQLEYAHKAQINIPDPISNIEYSLDQQVFVAVSISAGKVYIYDGILFNLLDSWTTPQQPLALALSSNKDYLAISYSNGVVSLHRRLSSNHYPHTPTYSISIQQSITKLAFVQNIKIVLGAQDGQLYLYDLPPMTKLNATLGIAVTSITVSPNNGRIVVSGGQDDQSAVLNIYQASSLSLFATIPVTYLVEDASFTPDGSQLILVGNTSQIVFYDSSNLTKIDSINTNAQVLYDVGISQNHLYLAAVAEGMTYVFQRTNSHWSPQVALSNQLSCMGLSSSGSELAMATHSQQIDIYGLCTNGHFYQPQYNLCGDCLLSCNICYGSSNHCLDCSQNRQLIGEQCRCVEGYYDNITCHKCNISGCFACQLHQQVINCTRCDYSSNWVHSDEGGCKCKLFYYVSTTVCQRCAVGCQICAQVNTKLTCQHCTQSRSISIDGICYCKAGTFERGDECQSCLVGCLNCDNQTICAICDDANNFQLLQNICICKDNYVLSGYQCIVKDNNTFVIIISIIAAIAVISIVLGFVYYTKKKRPVNEDQQQTQCYHSFENQDL